MPIEIENDTLQKQAQEFVHAKLADVVGIPVIAARVLDRWQPDSYDHLFRRSLTRKEKQALEDEMREAISWMNVWEILNWKAGA